MSNLQAVLAVWFAVKCERRKPCVVCFFQVPWELMACFCEKKKKEKTLVLQLHMQYVLKCKVIIKIVIKNVMLYKDYLK